MTHTTNFLYEYLSAEEVLAHDPRTIATHRSIYFSLFRQWNKEKFADEFHIRREEIMKYAGVRSTTTYTKCLKDLHTFGLIEYVPSKNIYKGSVIRMTKFWSCTDIALKKLCHSSNIALIQYRKHIKHLKQYKEDDNKKLINLNVEYSKNKRSNPTLEDVISFFLTKNQEDSAARKFYNHYQSRGWVTKSNQPITDWQAAANLWIEKSKEFLQKKSSPKLPRLRPTGFQPKRN